MHSAAHTHFKCIYKKVWLEKAALLSKGLLVVSFSPSAGADDFLPVLIYVVIHANPPQLASNLEYIQRFRMHSRMASESAYFFTQLVRAPSKAA